MLTMTRTADNEIIEADVKHINRNSTMLSFIYKFRKILWTFSLIYILCIGVSSAHGEMCQQSFLDTSHLLQVGKTRDSLAAQQALATWWPISMRNHDERIAWWRDSRFGCFIHWGVYSGAGGLWRGDTVHGYAEHLMRIKKIPLAVYTKEVAKEFDPVDFDADAWVAKIKQAGMRYLIITAKHHDGFAMYNSDVSAYNIVKVTPWHHDPMKDLAEACKKQGIKFGFYYSHAFDWQDPDAPGNDWDYNNPGGDKQLYGGKVWYDLHPDLWQKTEIYINQKAIPQIKELILKYHPDILWFDTPQKIPFSENLRILQEIRQIDTTVIINGRLARNGDMNFGDYKNTADRPKEFYPVEGDWEAIPTTNESYGYNQTDSYHKPASFFIRLLAKAASRGGNVLMNIGPMGNGRIDPKDTAILYAIGRWMNVNSESIYGTKATSLPLQAWGVSTQKGNTIYLQVFHWPTDGKLIVGGLKSNIDNAMLLSNKQKLRVKRLNDADIIISVPKKSPDTINTVIVLQCKEPIITSPTRLLSTTANNRLLAFDAKLHGKHWHFGDGKADRYYVYGWTNSNQYVSWQIRLNEPANYRMTIKYASDKRSKDNFYRIEIGDFGIKKKVRIPAGKTSIFTDDLGIVNIPQGFQTLTIKPVKINGSELMRVFEIDLEPVK